MSPFQMTPCIKIQIFLKMFRRIKQDFISEDLLRPTHEFSCVDFRQATSVSRGKPDSVPHVVYYSQSLFHSKYSLW